MNPDERPVLLAGYASTVLLGGLMWSFITGWRLGMLVLGVASAVSVAVIFVIATHLPKR
ncbi:MAG TPA: hypothetical protein VHN99_05085 [Deinococcales bacterium]|nr:hypothetical protein [Deinococcales bacterium]